MENKLLLNIIEDKYRKFEKDYAIVSTDFLDLAQQSISVSFLKNHVAESIFLYGGYVGAERKKIIFLPDYIDVFDEDQLADFFISAPDLCPLAVLDVKILAKGKMLRHSDYLGSLLSLGIKREKTGDILTFNDGAQIIVAEEIAAYLAENYTQVGKTPISATVIGIDKLKAADLKIERVKLSLASPRLDNAVSSVFGISRKSASEAISSGLVFVNSTENRKPDFMLKGGEKIVLRRKGKAIYRGSCGVSRKGKLYVEFDKYI